MLARTTTWTSSQTIVGKTKKRKQRLCKQSKELITSRFHEALDEVLAETIVDAQVLAEKVVAAATMSYEGSSGAEPTRTSRHSQNLVDLLEARRSIQDPDQRKDATLRIWSCLKEERKERESRKLDQLLESKKGKCDIQRILKAPVKRRHITAVVDSGGTIRDDKDEILEVFAKFYEDLYTAATAESTLPDEQGCHEPITSDEIRLVLNKIRKGKSCGDDGVYAEMLKTDHDGLLETIARIFTDILGGNAEVPASWCISRLVVLYKKGDSTLPKNYRPIAIILFYASFSVA